jgi:hypothetical protein
MNAVTFEQIQEGDDVGRLAPQVKVNSSLPFLVAPWFLQ